MSGPEPPAPSFQGSVTDSATELVGGFLLKKLLTFLLRHFGRTVGVSIAAAYLAFWVGGMVRLVTTIQAEHNVYWAASWGVVFAIWLLGFNLIGVNGLCRLDEKAARPRSRTAERLDPGALGMFLVMAGYWVGGVIIVVAIILAVTDHHGSWWGSLAGVLSTPAIISALYFVSAVFLGRSGGAVVLGRNSAPRNPRADRPPSDMGH